MSVEKRKYVRFLAEPSAYAALGFSFTRVGKIRDISMGGLVFEYLSPTNATSRQDSSVTILVTKNTFFLENLPCLIVCDRVQSNSDAIHFLNSNYLVNRCSLQFMTISEEQRLQLEYFINNYTIGNVPSASGPQEAN